MRCFFLCIVETRGAWGVAEQFCVCMEPSTLPYQVKSFSSTFFSIFFKLNFSNFPLCCFSVHERKKNTEIYILLEKKHTIMVVYMYRHRKIYFPPSPLEQSLTPYLCSLPSSFHMFFSCVVCGEWVFFFFIFHVVYYIHGELYIHVA